MQWVVETGIPAAEAARTVKALISSMQKPRAGVIVVISSPIALINFAPQIQSPAVIPRPPNANKYLKMIALESFLSTPALAELDIAYDGGLFMKLIQS